MQADIFYLSFDEPTKEQHWEHCRSIHPKSKRVDQVVGFDRAIKTCADQSTTEKFWVIDGDNWITSNLEEITFKDQSIFDNYIISFGARNSVNGLSYGNGGVKLWSRSMAWQMRTHESSDGIADFCYVLPYYIMTDVLSNTIINSSAKQAFRAGFREGVKLATIPKNRQDNEMKNLRSLIDAPLYEWLKIWMSVGSDVINGDFSMLGAQCGCIEQIQNPLTKNRIHDYQFIDRYFESQDGDVEFLIKKVSEYLGEELLILDAGQSIEFKRNYVTQRRSGPLNE